MMLNSVEIKVVRIRAKTPLEEFSHWVMSFYDRTTSSMCDMEMSATGILSWIGSKCKKQAKSDTITTDLLTRVSVSHFYA